MTEQQAHLVIEAMHRANNIAESASRAEWGQVIMLLVIALFILIWRAKD